MMFFVMPQGAQQQCLAPAQAFGAWFVSQVRLLGSLACEAGV